MSRHLADLELTMSESIALLNFKCLVQWHLLVGLLKEEGWMEANTDPNDLYTGVRVVIYLGDQFHIPCMLLCAVV